MKSIKATQEGIKSKTPNRPMKTAPSGPVRRRPCNESRLDAEDSINANENDEELTRAILPIITIPLDSCC